MKYVVALLLGLVSGAALFALGLLYNPFIADRSLSPLSVTRAETIALNFSPVPSESIVFTNDGERIHAPNPQKVLQLWEAPIRRTSAMVSLMRNARGESAGIGIKFSSTSERTRLFSGEALTDSVWYVYLPERGSMFIQQTENHWQFLRQVAFPAWRSSGNNWRGTWLGNLTSGPGALGTARVVGGSGSFRGLEMEAVESLTVDAFSADVGLVAAEGQLIIALPKQQEPEQPD